MTELETERINALESAIRAIEKRVDKMSDWQQLQFIPMMTEVKKMISEQNPNGRLILPK